MPTNVEGRPSNGTNLFVEMLLYFEQDNLHWAWDYKDNRNNGENLDDLVLFNID